jgi:hypothetical protein
MKKTRSKKSRDNVSLIIYLVFNYFLTEILFLMYFLQGFNSNMKQLLTIWS